MADRYTLAYTKSLNRGRVERGIPTLDPKSSKHERQTELMGFRDGRRLRFKQEGKIK